MMAKEIALTKGRVAIVDDDWYDMLSLVSWRANGISTHPYATSSTWVKGKTIAESMHRIIMDAKKGQEIDHINGNTLDNRRENLRFCNRSQNCSNKPKYFKNPTSVYKGVCFDPLNNKWIAQIQVWGINHKIGRFLTEKEAAIAYNEKAKDLHKKFAKLNDI